MEVDALCRYWQNVFNRDSIIDEGIAADILPHTPILPRHQLQLTQTEFARFITRAPSTAAGPDGVTYDMVRPLADTLGIIFADMMAGMSKGGSLPVHLSDSVTVFVAKKVGPVLQPGDFRPLSLNCVWSKTPAAVLARQLSTSSGEWVHPQQHGFTHARDTGDALLSLKTAAFSLSRLCKFSTALFADLAQAFASLSRTW
eukprot:1157708-Amphidinium_carterae.1